MLIWFSLFRLAQQFRPVQAHRMAADAGRAAGADAAAPS